MNRQQQMELASKLAPIMSAFGIKEFHIVVRTDEGGVVDMRGRGGTDSVPHTPDYSELFRALNSVVDALIDSEKKGEKLAFIKI